MSDPSGENVWITAAMGARLRKAREDKGLSQLQAADRLGISQVQISQYEKGEHDMALAHFFELAALLDISAADIFDA